jgi:hypothetical protein
LALDFPDSPIQLLGLLVGPDLRCPTACRAFFESGLELLHQQGQLLS